MLLLLFYSEHFPSRKWKEEKTEKRERDQNNISITAAHDFNPLENEWG